MIFVPNVVIRFYNVKFWLTECWRTPWVFQPNQ